jgi:hypothetical protein
MRYDLVSLLAKHLLHQKTWKRIVLFQASPSVVALTKQSFWQDEPVPMPLYLVIVR